MTGYRYEIVSEYGMTKFKAELNRLAAEGFQVDQFTSAPLGDDVFYFCAIMKLPVALPDAAPAN